MSSVIFVAAENGALPGAKVGGVADVIRELPAAVADEGWKPTVLNPSYGSLHRLPGARRLARVHVAFRGRRWIVQPYSVPGAHPKVRCVVLDHRLFVPTEPGIVYHGDAADRPFATDAGKFAFFCAAAAAWIIAQDRRPDVLHLHDWHCGVLAVLRAFDSRCEPLRRIRTAFTIHNLAYQGQRPKRGDASALDTWFPDLAYDPAVVADPSNHDVFNPMAAAIRLSDRINAVSPTYAGEIQRPSRPSAGFVGGEGLERLLQRRAAEGALCGILNGCEYPERPAAKHSWLALRTIIAEALHGWRKRDTHPDSLEAHALATATLERLGDERPTHILTSVGRIVDQKMRLFFAGARGGRTSLELILDVLGEHGVLILLGSGDAFYEQELARIAARRTNLLFLRGYSDKLGSALYESGDLFLMPSSYEPCGISQMLAMRNGQPCVVHGVGGLKDTVADGKTGFVFDGRTPSGQARHFVECVGEALRVRETDTKRWSGIRRAARARRFDWTQSARSYIRELYAPR